MLLRIFAGALTAGLCASLLACSDSKSKGDPSPTSESTPGADAGTDGEGSGVGKDAGTDGVAPPDGPMLSATERLFAADAPVWHFDLEVAPDDLAWLDDNATDEVYVPAAIEHEGQRNEDAMVRYKGSVGSLIGCFNDQGELTCPKLALKVSFNENDRAGRFLGVRKLLFHSCARDPSCLRERISYGLFRAVGVETCRAVNATVSINGGPPSLYALVEYIDKEFLEDHFEDPEGNLYKQAWPNSPSPGAYVGALRTNEDVANVDRMVALAGVVTASTLASFESDVAAYMDTERMARYNAVDQLISNWDGIWKFYCSTGGCGNHNFYIYDDPSSGQFSIIPWDLDHTWKMPNIDMGRGYFDDSPDACVPVPAGFEVGGIQIEIRAPQCDPLMAGLMIAGWDGYLAALRAALDGQTTSEAAVLERLDRYRALIRPAIEADPLSPSIEQWEASVAQLRQIIRASYGEAEKLLSE